MFKSADFCTNMQSQSSAPFFLLLYHLLHYHQCSRLTEQKRCRNETGKREGGWWQCRDWKISYLSQSQSSLKSFSSFDDSIPVPHFTHYLHFQTLKKKNFDLSITLNLLVLIYFLFDHTLHYSVLPSSLSSIFILFSGACFSIISLSIFFVILFIYLFSVVLIFTFCKPRVINSAFTDQSLTAADMLLEHMLSSFVLVGKNCCQCSLHLFTLQCDLSDPRWFV